MGANYKESEIGGAAYNRVRGINIDNPDDTQPSVRFDWETVLKAEGFGTLRKPADSVTVWFDPAREFPLLDPRTGEAVGASMSYGQVYAILYSAAVFEAQEKERMDAEALAAAEQARAAAEEMMLRESTLPVIESETPK